MSEWISVDDRLPEIPSGAQAYVCRVNVIAWGNGWREPRQLAWASNQYAKTEKGRAPRWEEADGRLSFSQPTHWMRMPLPPM